MDDIKTMYQKVKEIFTTEHHIDLDTDNMLTEQLFTDYLSSQLEPPVIKWREYKAEQPHYEGRFLIYYEYNNNPNIRNIFIADYLPAEGRFMNVLNDIEILYWAEVQPPSL